MPTLKVHVRAFEANDYGRIDKNGREKLDALAEVDATGTREIVGYDAAEEACTEHPVDDRSPEQACCCGHRVDV
jgi:hypothetical protein